MRADLTVTAAATSIGDPATLRGASVGYVFCLRQDEHDLGIDLCNLTRGNQARYLGQAFA